MSAQFEVKRDLKFLTEGLSARLLFNTSRISSYDVSRKLNPYYYKMTNYDYRFELRKATTNDKYFIKEGYTTCLLYTSRCV